MTDAENGQRTVVREGPALPAIMASAALPELFTILRWGPGWELRP